MSLLLLTIVLTMMSERVGVPAPILLLAAGLGVSLLPGVPLIRLAPDVVFLLFLPPLLHSAAWETSWPDFHAHRFVIRNLALGLVLLTSGIVAAVAHAVIPGFSLAMGFLLGGIVAPPDAVAATAVLRDLPIPRRVVTILEGESLVNDASSLIVFRFALAAVVTGQFVFGGALQTFAVVVAGGVGIGLVQAYGVYLIHRFLPTNAAMDAALTLLTPYLLYLTAESFHVSGVLAVVTGGLLQAHLLRGTLGYESTINLHGFWNTLVFLLHGFVFLLMGLQMPTIVAGLHGVSLGAAIGYGLLISAVVIVVRLAWVAGEAALRYAWGRRREPLVWGEVVVIAWSGMRGIVSLAAALAVPLSLAGEAAFPQRNLLLFITFIVILVTLGVQGLTLSPLARRLRFAPDTASHAPVALQADLIYAAVAHLHRRYAAELRQEPTFQQVVQELEQQLVPPVANADPAHARYRQMRQELIDVRLRRVQHLRRRRAYAEELLRECENRLHLEEGQLLLS